MTRASSASAATITARAVSRLHTLNEGTAKWFRSAKSKNKRGLVTNIGEFGFGLRVDEIIQRCAVAPDCGRHTAGVWCGRVRRRLEALQHDLAPRLAALDERVDRLEVGGIDGGVSLDTQKPIRNKNTRAAYYQAIGQFLDWCQRGGFSNLEDIEPIHVAAYIEQHSS
jgi:hypothetical protein